jgi:hypothetical protein
MKVTSSRQFSHNNLKIVLVLFCLITTAARAKDPSWIHAHSFGGSGDDFAWRIKVGPDNHEYVTGSFSGTVQFGHTTLVSLGSTDIFLAKYGHSGEPFWVVGAGGPTFDGGPSNDSGKDLAFDRAGNIYLTGSFIDNATFGSTDGATKTLQGLGPTTFLAKYRPTGVLVWVQIGLVAPFRDNYAFGVAVNADTGSVYMTGYSQEETSFSSADGTIGLVPGVGTWHMFLVKYDTNGNFQWGQTNAASPNSIPYGVAVDARDNAYVTGWLENTATFSSNDGNDITVTGFSPGQSTGDFPDDAFLAKYDRDGNVKWVNHVGGYKGQGSGVAVSPSGEISIAGFVGNIIFGSPGEAETIATSQPPGTNMNLGGGDFTHPFNRDALIATYDAAGVLRRTFRHVSSKDDVDTALAYDLRGNLYATRVFLGTNNQPNLVVLKYSGNKLLWRGRECRNLERG